MSSGRSSEITVRWLAELVRCGTDTDMGFVICFIMNGISKVFFGIRMGNGVRCLSTRVIQLPRLTDFTSFLSSPVFPGLPGRLLVMDTCPMSVLWFTLLHTSQLSALARHNSCQPINFWWKNNILQNKQSSSCCSECISWCCTFGVQWDENVNVSYVNLLYFKWLWFCSLWF